MVANHAELSLALPRQAVDDLVKLGAAVDHLHPLPPPLASLIVPDPLALHRPCFSDSVARRPFCFSDRVAQSDKVAPRLSAIHPGTAPPVLACIAWLLIRWFVGWFVAFVGWFVGSCVRGLVGWLSRSPIEL